MKQLCVLIFLGGMILPSTGGAADLKQSKFTQVVNSVQVISSDNTPRPAEVNDVFKMPDVLRTGPGSRAELVADDHTITRVGANTIFSLDPANRTIDLQQGSLLFHAPHGKGGGTIHTGSATASVIGTTIIVTTTPNGGFKILDLEGEAEIRFLNGLKEKLLPGQMTFVLPGGAISPIVVFRLDDETKGSLLVNGFNNPLPSWPQIEAEITRQLTLLLNSRIVDVNLLVGDNATPDTVQVVMNINHENQPSDAAIISPNHSANQPKSVNYSPLDSKHVQGNSFAGINIDIDTGNVPVDLSAFAGHPEFDIVASGDMRIWNDLYFGGVAPTVPLGVLLPDTVALIAGGKMIIAQGVTLEADTKLFELSAKSFGTMAAESTDGSVIADDTLEGIRVINNRGDVDILSDANLTIEDGSTITAGSSGDVTGDVSIESTGGSLTLGNTQDYSRLDGGHDVWIDAGGSVYLDAANNLTLNNTEVDAGGNINLDSDFIYSGNITVGNGASLYAGGDINIGQTVLTQVGGNIDIEGSTIYAGDGYYASTGGNVNINAYNGNIDLSGNEIQANYGSETYENGNITINASGNVTIYSTDIYADGNININGGYTISETSDGDISGGYVDIENDGENNCQIYAYNGAVNINGNGADGYVYIYYGDIEAGEDTDSACDLTIRSYDSTVDIDDTYLYASGDVYLESSGTLTVENNSEIDAYGSNGISLASNYADVDVHGSYLYAYGGNVNVVAPGNIDIENSDLKAYNDVNIYGGNTVLLSLTGESSSSEIPNVYISGSEIYSGYDSDNSGTLNIYGTSVGIFDNSEIYAYGGNINIISEGDSSFSGSEIDIENSYITAGQTSDYSDYGGSVTINSHNGGVYLYDDSIYAYAQSSDNAGYVNIYGAGSVDSDYSHISGDNDVTIEAGDTLTIENGSTVESAGQNGVSLTSDNAGVNVDSSSIYAYNGRVNIAAPYGSVTVSGDSYIQAYGDVNINAGDSISPGILDTSSGFGDVYIDSSEIIAGYNADISGTVNITAGGYVTIADSSSIYANGNVNISGNGSLMAISSSSETSAGGTIDIQNSYIYAGYNADIDEPSGPGGSIAISAPNGGIYLSSDDIYAYSSSDSSADGSVNISGGQNIIINGNSDIYADGDINITSGVSVSTSGETSSSGSGAMIDIEDTEIYSGYDNFNGQSHSGGDVNINAYNGDIYLAGDDIEANYGYDSNGNINVYSTGNITITGSSVDASGDVSIISGGISINSLGSASSYGDICISGSEIYAGDVTDYGGSVYVYAGGNVAISDSSVVAYDAVNINGGLAIQSGVISSVAPGSINIENSDIKAGWYINNDETSLDGGNVSITASGDGNVYLNNDTIYAYGGKSYDGDITIDANGGNIDVLYSDLNADNLVTLRAAGYVNVVDSYNSPDLAVGYWLVNAGGDADFHADGNLTVSDASITAGGDVNMTAGQSISVTGGNHYNQISGDNVNMTAGHSISISGEAVVANTGDININAGSDEIPSASYNHVSEISKAITLGTVGNISSILPADLSYNGSDIEISGGNVNISDSGNVSIDDSTISASLDSSSANGNVSISSGGILTIGTTDDSSSSVTAGGSINLQSSGDMNISSTTLSASGTDDNGNSLVINSGGNVDLEDSTLNLSGNLHGNASGYINIVDVGGSVGGSVYLQAGDYISAAATDGNLSLDSWDIYAGTYANLSANNGEVSIFNGDIEAYNGDITISSTGTISQSTIIGVTGVDIENSYLDASGSVSISAGDNIYLGNNSGDYGIYADGGNVSVLSSAGQIDVDNSYLQANNNVSLESSDTLTVENGSTISAGKMVSLISDNSDVNIQSSEIDAGADHSVSITGTSFNAAQNIFVNVAGGGVDISGANVTLEQNTFNLGGDVTVDNSSLIAENGSVNITATGSLSVSATGTSVIDNNTINASSIKIEDGSTITAVGGNVTLENNISLPVSAGFVVNGGDVDISDSDISATASVSASKAQNFSSGEIYISSASGNVNITSSGISADNGVTVNAAGYVDLFDVDSVSESLNLSISDWNITAGSYIEIGADGDVNISSSSIAANGGGVDIYAGDGLDLHSLSSANTADGIGGSVKIASDSSVSASGDVDVYGGYGLYLSISDDSSESENDGAGTGANVTICASSISANDNVELDGGYGIDFEGYAGGDVLNKGNGLGGDVKVLNGSSVSGYDADIYGGEGVYLAVDSDGSIENDGAGVGGKVLVCNSAVSASENVNLIGGDGIDMEADSYGDGYYYSSEVNSGDGTGGSVNIANNSSISAGYDADIYGGDGIYFDIESGNAGFANSNFGNGTGGGVTICSSTISISAGNNIYISGGDGISLQESYDNAGEFNAYNSGNGVGGCVSISSASSVSAQEDISISGGNGVNIFSFGAFNDDSSFSQATISGSETGTGGDVQITADSTVSTADGSIDIFGGNGISAVAVFAGNDGSGFGGNVEISSSQLSAANNVTISGGDGINLFGYEAVENGLEIPTQGTGGNVTIGNSSISAAAGNVNIFGGDGFYDGALAISGVGSSSAGSAIINDGSGTGGNVEISAGNISAGANVIISGGSGVNIEAVDTIENESDVIGLGGSVTISSGSTVSASGSIEIFGGDGIDLSATQGGGDDYGTGTGGNVSISSSTISATGGNILIWAGDGINISGGISSYGEGIAGNVTIDASTIAAGGRITINAGGNYAGSFDGNVTIEDGTTIQAGGDVNINVDDSISLGSISSISSGYGDVNISASTIEAGYNTDTGGNANIYAGGNIMISDSTVDAYNNVNINSGEAFNIKSLSSVTPGTVDIENSDISAGYDSAHGAVSPGGGDVTIQAHNGDAYLNNDVIRAVSGNSTDGEISVSADGNIDVLYSDLSADDSVTVDAQNGYVNIVDSYDSSTLSIGNWNITAGTYVDLTADGDGNLEVCYSQIYADNGNIDFSAGGDIYLSGDDVYAGYENTSASDSVNINAVGNISIKNSSYIQASGDVDINAGNAVALESFTSSGYGDVNIDSSTIYAGYDTDAGGMVNITAGGNINITGNNTMTVIYAYNDVNITSGEVVAPVSPISLNGIDMENSTIGAGFDAYADDSSAGGGNVNIAAYSGNVYLNGDLIFADAVSDNGNINVMAAGNIDALNTTLSADDTVTLNAGGYVNVVDSYDSSSLSIGGWDITAGSYADLTADGSLEIYNSSITANGGDVNITAGTISLTTINTSGGITIGANTSIEASDSVNVYAYNGDIVINGGGSEAASLTADTGSVTISAIGNVDIENTTISATGGNSDIDVLGNSTQSSFDYVASGGIISITAGGDVTLNSDTFNLGGNINISGATLTATVGDFDATADWNVTGSLTPGDLANCTVNGSAINIVNSTIWAKYGNINLTAGQNISVEDSSLSASPIENSGSAVSGQDVNISSSWGQVSIASSDSVVSTSVTAGNAITINANSGVTVSEASIAAPAEVNINNASGLTTINNGSSVQTAYLDVNSGDGILIDGTHGGSIVANTMRLAAGMGGASGGPTITVQGENLATVGAMNVSAHTVDMEGDNFSSANNYTFTVFHHGYYIDNGVQAGYANFNGCKVDNVSIQNLDTASTLNPNNTGNIQIGGTGAGIHVN